MCAAAFWWKTSRLFSKSMKKSINETKQHQKNNEIEKPNNDLPPQQSCQRHHHMAVRCEEGKDWLNENNVLKMEVRLMEVLVCQKTERRWPVCISVLQWHFILKSYWLSIPIHLPDVFHPLRWYMYAYASPCALFCVVCLLFYPTPDHKLYCMVFT